MFGRSIPRRTPSSSTRSRLESDGEGWWGRSMIIMLSATDTNHAERCWERTTEEETTGRKKFFNRLSDLSLNSMWNRKIPVFRKFFKNTFHFKIAQIHRPYLRSDSKSQNIDLKIVESPFESKLKFSTTKLNF